MLLAVLMPLGSATRMEKEIEQPLDCLSALFLTNTDMDDNAYNTDIDPISCINYDGYNTDIKNQEDGHRATKDSNLSNHPEAFYFTESAYSESTPGRNEQEAVNSNGWIDEYCFSTYEFINNPLGGITPNNQESDISNAIDLAENRSSPENTSTMNCLGSTSFTSDCLDSNNCLESQTEHYQAPDYSTDKPSSSKKLHKGQQITETNTDPDKTKFKMSKPQRCADISTSFDKFRDFIHQMIERDDFKKDLRKMIQECYMEEIRSKRKLLFSSLYSLKNRGERLKAYCSKYLQGLKSFEELLCPDIELDSNFIDLFANILKIGDRCSAFNRASDIKGALKLAPSSKLFDYMNHLKECLSVFENLHRQAHENNIFDTVYCNSDEIFNKTVLILVEDVLVRLEADFKLRHLFHNSNTSYPLGDGIFDYLKAVLEAFRALEENPNQNKAVLKKTIEQIGGKNEHRFGFFRLEHPFRDFNSTPFSLEGYDKFIVQMYTRSRILHRTFSLFRGIVYDGRHLGGRLHKKRDLPLLILYSYLDFEKIEKFRLEYFQRTQASDSKNTKRLRVS